MPWGTIEDLNEKRNKQKGKQAKFRFGQQQQQQQQSHFGKEKRPKLLLTHTP